MSRSIYITIELSNTIGVTQPTGEVTKRTKISSLICVVIFFPLRSKNHLLMLITNSTNINRQNHLLINSIFTFVFTMYLHVLLNKIKCTARLLRIFFLIS